MNYKNEDGTIEAGKVITHIIAGIIGLTVIFGSFTIVKAGSRGIILRLGAVNRVLDEGLHFKFPVVEGVKKVDVRINKIETHALAYSKDIQTIDTLIAVNFHLKAEAVGKIFQEVGSDIQSRIIDPAIQEAVKASTAQFTAQELIEERPKVKEAIKAHLTERLAIRDIIVSEVSIVNFDFSEAYEKATELKQVAQQDALAAKNKLEQVKFEADQRVAQAQAEAEAIRIQAQAITQQGGEDYVNLKAIEKWNGILPAQMIPNGTLPFINLTK